MKCLTYRHLIGRNARKNESLNVWCYANYLSRSIWLKPSVSWLRLLRTTFRRSTFYLQHFHNWRSLVQIGLLFIFKILITDGALSKLDIIYFQDFDNWRSLAASYVVNEATKQMVLNNQIAFPIPFKTRILLKCEVNIYL